MHSGDEHNAVWAWAWRHARLVARRVGRLYLARRDRSDYHQSFAPYGVGPVRQRGRPPRPRILHAIANFGIGGSSQLVVDLIEGLSAEVDQRVIVCSLPRITAYTGVQIDEYRYLRSCRPLMPLVARFKPDLIHLHNVADHREPQLESYGWYLHVLACAEAAGVRVVQNVNIPTEPYRAPTVVRYIYVSNYVRREYGRGAEPAVVIYPGSDLMRFRRPSNLGRTRDTIGLVYRLEFDKLSETSVNPLLASLQTRHAAQAVVVGGGRYLPAFRRSAAIAGVEDRIKFTGFVSYENLASLYAEMSVFVAPVHTESFGQVSVFAMGMELPVAGYRVGALEEILGHTDTLARPGDEGELARILVELLDDPQRSDEIGRENRRRAEKLFSVSTMVDRYRELYREVLAESH